jgi:hypothetical protein
MTFDEYWTACNPEKNQLTERDRQIARLAWIESQNQTVPTKRELHEQKIRDYAWADFQDSEEWEKSLLENVHPITTAVSDDLDEFNERIEAHGKMCFERGIQTAIGKSAEDERRSYVDIREGLRGLPMTFYPDLLKTVAEESVSARVWQPGGLSRFVSQFEPIETERSGNEIRGILG